MSAVFCLNTADIIICFLSYVDWKQFFHITNREFYKLLRKDDCGVYNYLITGRRTDQF